MKARTIVLALVLMLLTPAFAAAQAATTSITGTELFDPLNLLGNGSVGTIVNPGQVTCPGTQPTGDPTQPCPVGSRIHIRGAALTSIVIGEDNDPWLTGMLSITGNSNLDADATGHAWGMFRIDLDAGGVWEGSWTGKRSRGESLVWTTHIRGVGRGTSGDVQGKQLGFDEVITSPAPVSVAYIGAIAAEVLSPPSSE